MLYQNGQVVKSANQQCLHTRTMVLDQSKFRVFKPATHDLMTKLFPVLGKINMSYFGHTGATTCKD